MMGPNDYTRSEKVNTSSPNLRIATPGNVQGLVMMFPSRSEQIKRLNACRNMGKQDLHNLYIKLYLINVKENELVMIY